MGKFIFVIACILLAVTIAAGLLFPQLTDFIGWILIAIAIIFAISVLLIAKETRPQRF